MTCGDEAQIQLSEMLFKGEGIKQDKIEAMAWFHIAIKRQSEYAKIGVRFVEKEVSAAEKTLAQTKATPLEKNLQCPK